MTNNNCNIMFSPLPCGKPQSRPVSGARLVVRYCLLFALLAVLAHGEDRKKEMLLRGGRMSYANKGIRFLSSKKGGTMSRKNSSKCPKNGECPSSAPTETASLAPTIEETSPANTCADQSRCLSFTSTPLEMDRHEICMTWSVGGSCAKVSPIIEQMCLAGGDGFPDKVFDRWEAGDKKCQVVNCGVSAIFGIKDNGCSGGSLQADKGLDELLFCASSFACDPSGGACQWFAPAPSCSPP